MLQTLRAKRMAFTQYCSPTGSEKNPKFVCGELVVPCLGICSCWQQTNPLIELCDENETRRIYLVLRSISHNHSHCSEYTSQQFGEAVRFVIRGEAPFKFGTLRVVFLQCTLLPLSSRNSGID